MKFTRNVRFLLIVISMLVLAFPASVGAQSGSNAGEAFNMEVVGHNNLGGRGFNADVWVHKGYAYVGQWGFGDWAAGSKDRFCPAGSNTSALIVDARDRQAVRLEQRLDRAQILRSRGLDHDFFCHEVASIIIDPSSLSRA